jgi:hypothetical protein
MLERWDRGFAVVEFNERSRTRVVSESERFVSPPQQLKISAYGPGVRAVCHDEEEDRIIEVRGLGIPADLGHQIELHVVERDTGP